MSSRSIAGTLLLSVLTAACAATDESQRESNGDAAADLAITHIDIINVADGAVIPDQTVLIRGNRIARVAPSEQTRISASVPVVDARGRYLIPGLWDMHVHSAASTSWHFPLFIAHGITGVRNLHTTVDTALELTGSIKRRLDSGDLLGPRFLANGPILDGEPPSWPGAVVVRTAPEARAAVDSLADGGADFIKVYDNLTREAYFAIADQAKRRGIPVVGHVPFAVRPEEAADAGHRTDEHMLGLESGCSSRADSIRAERRRAVSLPFPEVVVALFRLERAQYDTRDPSLCAAVVQAYLRNGTAVVPNLVIHRNSNGSSDILSDSARMRYVPVAARPEWELRAGPGPGDEIRRLMRPTWPQRLENVKLLYDAGVPILAGTDVGNPFLVPGISLHRELELLVEAGLSSLDALRAATLNPARYLDATDSLGTVEAGKLADLVLLEANPLEKITNTRKIAGVVLNGRYMDRAALDAMLAEVEAVARGGDDSGS